MHAGERHQFVVSDSLVVPLRGQLLRLRLSAAAPPVSAVAVGSTLRVRAPDGRARDVHILDHSMTGGRVTQGRLERVRELDVIVRPEEAAIDGEPIGIGWTVGTANE
jgi:hypothetical protein